MKTFEVFCNKVYKGDYQASWHGGAIAVAFKEHGDTCHPGGHIGHWTAKEKK